MHQGGKKDGRFRVDPDFFKWCVALCARTSQTLYDELASVFILPSRQYVSRLEKHEGVMSNATNFISFFGIRSSDNKRAWLVLKTPQILASTTK